MIKMNLNDLPRMNTWQNAIPDLESQLSQPKGTELSPEIADYLACYGLDACRNREDVTYFVGYRDVAGFRVLHQCFLQKGSFEENTAKDMVLIVHGYTDHAGLFTKVINNLLKEGKSILLFDFPGHGLSSGARASITSFNGYLEVLDDCVQFFSSTFTCDLHVIAQSMGGAITMNWLLSDTANQEKLRNVVLFAPLVRPMAWRKAIWSFRFLSKVLNSIPRNFSDNSEDKQFLHFVRYEDPVQHDRLPTQWVGSMIKWVKQFEALTLRPACNFPISIIQGDQDQTVDWVYNLNHIKSKFARTQVFMIKGAGHHIAGESDRLQKEIMGYVKEVMESK